MGTVGFGLILLSMERNYFIVAFIGLKGVTAF